MFPANLSQILSSELLKPLFKFGVRKLSPPYRTPLLGLPGTIYVEE